MIKNTNRFTALEKFITG